MMETINYRGFQLQVSLDIPNEYLVGEVILDESLKDLKFWEASDSFSDLIEKFENYIQTFLEENKETFIYKNITLEITKAVGGKWRGNSDYFLQDRKSVV